MSLTSRRTTGDGDTTSAEEKETILPSTVRADGSVRKPIRIRAGYVNQFEVKKYVSPALRKRQEEVKEEEEKKASSSAKSSSSSNNENSSSNSAVMPATLNNNNNTTTAAQRKNAKRREKKRLEQLQVEEQKQEKTIPTKKEEEEGANAEQEEYLTTEIKQLRKQLQQCERIERKRIEDESKVRPSEWVKLGEYDETVDALEKLQRDLANMQFPASEEKKEKKERKE